MPNLVSAYPRAPLVFPGRANARGPRPPLIGAGAGIAAAVAAPSYANPGGQGDRNSIVTVTANLAPSGGLITELLDGITNASSPLFYANNAGLPTITYDFAVPKIITELTQYWAGVLGGTYAFDASTNNASWNTLVASFAGDAATKIVTVPGVPGSGYRYYRLRMTVQNSLGFAWYETEYKIGDAG